QAGDAQVGRAQRGDAVGPGRRVRIPGGDGVTKEDHRRAARGGENTAILQPLHGQLGNAAWFAASARRGGRARQAEPGVGRHDFGTPSLEGPHRGSSVLIRRNSESAYLTALSTGRQGKIGCLVKLADWYYGCPSGRMFALQA